MAIEDALETALGSVRRRCSTAGVLVEASLGYPIPFKSTKIGNFQLHSRSDYDAKFRFNSDSSVRARTVLERKWVSRSAPAEFQAGGYPL